MDVGAGRPYASGRPALVDRERTLPRSWWPDRACAMTRRVRTTGGNVDVLKRLIGSGDRIALFTLPFVAIGIGLAIANPSMFASGDSQALRVLSIVVLVVGIAIWMWSVILILTNVPSGRLITGGPYAWMRHPIYTAVALLVLPSLGFLFGTWLGVVIGAALYVGSRIYAPAEEAELSQTFGEAWRQYDRSVRLRWL
jgi:protein-S-isoprenylcysteine O-methyltransferase Ste14